MKGDLNLSGRAFGGHLDQNAPHGGQVSFGGAKGQHCLLVLVVKIYLASPAVVFVLGPTDAVNVSTDTPFQDLDIFSKPDIVRISN